MILRRRRPLGFGLYFAFSFRLRDGFFFFAMVRLFDGYFVFGWHTQGGQFCCPGFLLSGAKPVYDSKLVSSSSEGDNLFKMLRLIWCITREETNLSASFLCASQRIGTSRGSRGPISVSLFFFSFMLRR